MVYCEGLYLFFLLYNYVNIIISLYQYHYINISLYHYINISLYHYIDVYFYISISISIYISISILIKDISEINPIYNSHILKSQLTLNLFDR